MDTLATALNVRADDELKMRPELGIYRPRVGIAPKLTDAELITLAVMQALLGISSKTRFLRYARRHLVHLFPDLPNQSGYNKRLRAAALQLRPLIRILAGESERFFDDIWLVDSTPVECGRSRETAKRSELAGFASYGVLREPQPLLLGAAAPPRLHAVGVADHLWPLLGEDRRARGVARPPRDRA